VVKFEKNVVQGVVAPEAVAWFIGQPPKWAVVTPIGRIFTPSLGRTDPANREQGPWPWLAIGPPPQPYRPKPAAGGGAVAFALIGLDAGAAERHGHRERTGTQPAPRTPTRPRAYLDPGKSEPSHLLQIPAAEFPTHPCSCILECSTSR